MVRCAACGEENPERARFCLNCGQAMTATTEPAFEVRKTVTILFADVVNSTGRGERTDPESTRHLLARYFDAMRGVLERHGGTVEKFIGDAVMAVFGIPTLHEDDAQRAARAAVEMRETMRLLNGELASEGWPPISLRIGINTGEVVAGDPQRGQTLVTGDAVNVAARLEQAAAPDEILVGATTQRLVRDLAELDAPRSLELRGKAAAVPAYPLLAVSSAPAIRRSDTPLVGRQRELRLLREALARATTERACHLFTLLGPAGVGKSRLVHEFLTGAHATAQVLRARCLPYGEGITYWPVVELTQAAARIGPADPPEEARRKLEGFIAADEGREAIVERVGAAIGLSTEAVPREEIFWGVRRLLEVIARERPLIVVIDDLHWAEPTLLDLVEYIADLSRDAPILLLGIARPELLEQRPHWAGGKLNATTILLEPLNAEESEQLVVNLIGDPRVAQALQDRLGNTAEGNPLFVEELVAMLVEEGVLRREDDGWAVVSDLADVEVPPSVTALVAARLDHLEPPERDLVGRASVVGKVFQRSAVSELSPPERRPELPGRLMTLVRKELVRPDASAAAGDDAFRFRHILVRDAAYAALPKEQRAELHARFAEWLEHTVGERLVEYEELLGYHLEQAYRYRSELGLRDDLTASIRDRAAAYLRSSGERAAARRDPLAAINLLNRAVALIPQPRERSLLQILLAWQHAEVGRTEDVTRSLRDAIEGARAGGDELMAAVAELREYDWRLMIDPTLPDEPLLTLAARVEELAESDRDVRALIYAAMSRSTFYLVRVRWADQVRELERVWPLLDELGDEGVRAHVAFQIWNALRYGPMPASEALRRIEDGGGIVQWSTGAPGFIAPLLAMTGRFEEARALVSDTLAFLTERGMTMRIGGLLGLAAADVERLARDYEAADRVGQRAIEILGSVGESGVLSTAAAWQALVRYRMGRADDALASIEIARRTGGEHDIATQAGWRAVAAMLAADSGERGEAERLIGEAVAMVEAGDFLELRGLVFEALAHVARARGDEAGAETALRRAMGEYEAKEDRADLDRLRA